MLDEKMTDHDLLIRLDTRFEEFQKNHTNMWESFNKLVQNFLLSVEKKADKIDLSDLVKEVSEIKKKVDEHETSLKVSSGKNQFAFQMGEWGLKSWGALKRGFNRTVETTKLTIFNTVDYFKYHQSSSGRPPQRKMLTINSKVIETVVNAINEYIIKSIKK